MDELSEFISVLNAECDVLKKSGFMPTSIDEPWRYYSAPLDDEHSHELLRAVIEAGRFTVEAETFVLTGDEAGAWRSLAKAQGALLKSLSSHGKAMAKKIGNSTGGKSKFDNVHYMVFCIADDLLAAGHKERGLARKVADELNKRGYPKNENQVKKILNEQTKGRKSLEEILDEQMRYYRKSVVAGNKARKDHDTRDEITKAAHEARRKEY